jgi:peptidoglycan-associated lipoprotein
MRLLTIALIAGLGLTAGCAKKRDAASLPPPPPTEGMATADASGGTAGGVGSVGVPGGPGAGTRADFVAQAGSDRVLFGLDSYDLDDSARSTLDAQAAWLARNGQVRVTIEGHADERGTREYNLALGERRALAVRDYLAARGVSATRMNTISYGKERPEVEGQDEGSWARNRRAVTVVPEGVA